MRNAPTVSIAAFGGLNNKVDPERVGVEGLIQADNVNIDSRGVVSAREGQTVVNTTSYRGAYATQDARRCYAVTAVGFIENWSVGRTGGELTGADTRRRTIGGFELLDGEEPATGLIVMESGDTIVLEESQSNPFRGYPYWTQIADIVFVGNESQVLRIGPDHSVMPNALPTPDPLQLSATGGHLPAGQYRFIQVAVVSGRESAPSDEAVITINGGGILVEGVTGQRIYVCPADSQVFGWWRDTSATALVYTASADSLGEELQTAGLQAMPTGRCLAAYQGRLYVAVYEPRTDRTAIYRSFGQWWDLCDMHNDHKIVPGEVRAMAGHPQGLLIGTERNLWALVDDTLTKLAEYGVPPGQPIAIDSKGQLGIATRRGFCTAFPFAELTATHFELPDADWSGSAFVRDDGEVRLIAAISPFAEPDNAWSAT